MSQATALPVRIYRPQGRTGSPMLSLQLAFQEVWLTRWIIWSLFVRDFLTQYRQRLLGYLWTFLNPLLQVATFVFMNSTGMLNPGELNMPYPVYVYVGTGLWGLFIAVTQTVSGGVQSHGDLVLRAGIPKIALAVAGMAGVAYNLMIHFITLGVLLCWYQLPATWTMMLYPLCMLPLIAMGMAVGFVLAGVGTLARDITSIVMTGLNMMMYVTPVIYAARFEHPLLRGLVNWNPMTYLIDLPRSALLGVCNNLWCYGVSVGVAIVLLVLGLHVFYRIQDQISERL